MDTALTTEKPKLYTASFIKICLVNFFIFVNFHALLPTFPFYVTYLGGDTIAIGLATALFSLASIIARPFAGWLIDTKGRATVLIISLVGMTLIPMGYFVSTGISLAILLRTIHGVFHASGSNAASTWVTDIVPLQRMGEGLGFYGLSMALSTAVAPALGLLLMNRVGFSYLFISVAAAGMLALVISTTIKHRSYALSTQPLKIGQLFEKLSLPASITQFFFMMAYGVVEVYVAIYAEHHNLLDGGIYFISIAIATVITRILLGKTIDRDGAGILIHSGNVLLIIGILLLVFMHNYFGYILSALMLGVSFGAVQPSLQTMAMRAVPPQRRGAASSTFFVAFDFGIALGGLLSGILAKYLGYDVMFIAIALCGIFSSVYFYFFASR